MTPSFYQAPPAIHWIEDPEEDRLWASDIGWGHVRGLSKLPEESKHRQGTLVLKEVVEARHKLKIVADHAYPIPDGFYTLVCYYSQVLGSYLWVAGQKRQDGKFRKFSVFHSADKEKVKALEFRHSIIYLC